MIFIQLSDFTGKYDIPDTKGLSKAQANVQEMIDKYEKIYIYNLIGVTEGDKLIAYQASSKTPPNTDYDKIINPFYMDNPFLSGQVVKSLGISEYLKAGIFYETVKNGLQLLQAGVANTKAETASKMNPKGSMRFAENKFNDILDTVYSIQWYCRNNITSFPGYNGQRIVVKCANFF